MKHQLSTFVLPLITLILMISSMLTIKNTYAETTITYPISELNNCASKTTCRDYCDKQENQQVCIKFAKTKGIYNPTLETSKITKALPLAQQELQCTALEDCKKQCELPQNFSKCSEFAKKANISGGIIKNPDQKTMLAKAEDTLGCTTLEACKTICDKQENKVKCTEFAKKIEAYTGPAASSAFENANDNARFCREFPEKCKDATPSPKTTVTPKPTDKPKESSNSTQAPKSTTKSSATPMPSTNEQSFASPTPTPTITPSPSPSKTPSPTPTNSPSPTPTQAATIPNGATVGSDGTWCLDNDYLGPSTGGTYMAQTKSSCQDSTGSHADYCQDPTTVRDYYCTSTWDGVAIKNVRCEAGGYVCSSHIGNGCFDGACNPPATVQGTSTTEKKTTVWDQVIKFIKSIF